jgi:hypothetical protein
MPPSRATASKILRSPASIASFVPHGPRGAGHEE